MKSSTPSCLDWLLILVDFSSQASVGVLGAQTSGVTSESFDWPSQLWEHEVAGNSPDSKNQGWQSIFYHTYIILFVDVYALSWVTGQQAITEMGNHIISWHQPQFLEYRYNTYRPMIIKTSTVNRSRNIQTKKYTGNWAPSFYPTDAQTFFVLSSRCRWL